MDDLKKSQEAMGAAAAGVRKQLSETAADAKEKLTDLGRDAAGQLSDVAQSAMAEDVKEVVKRYPGWSLAAAAVAGFLLAHLRSRD